MIISIKWVAMSPSMCPGGGFESDGCTLVRFWKTPQKSDFWKRAGWLAQLQNGNDPILKGVFKIVPMCARWVNGSTFDRPWTSTLVQNWFKTPWPRKRPIVQNEPVAHHLPGTVHFWSTFWSIFCSTFRTVHFWPKILKIKPRKIFRIFSNFHL